jgi:hypothetical protein
VSVSNFLNLVFIEPHFYTGSQSFYCAGESSDIDICFQEQDRHKVVSRLIGLEIPHTAAGYGSLKADLSKFGPYQQPVNFMFLDEVNYKAWKDATASAICHLTGRVEAFAQDKKIRYAIFEALVVAAGGTLPKKVY